MKTVYAALLWVAISGGALFVSACSSGPQTFQARNGYPPDPWVKGYADVEADGSVANVRTERSVPENIFEKHTIRTLKTWSFAPPKSEGLQNCRILIRYRWGIVSLA